MNTLATSAGDPARPLPQPELVQLAGWLDDGGKDPVDPDTELSPSGQADR